MPSYLCSSLASLGGIMSQFVMFTSGLAGIVALLIGAIGPGLGLLAVAFISYHFAVLKMEREQENLRAKLYDLRHPPLPPIGQNLDR